MPIHFEKLSGNFSWGKCTEFIAIHVQFSDCKNHPEVSEDWFDAKESLTGADCSGDGRTEQDRRGLERVPGGSLMLRTGGPPLAPFQRVRPVSPVRGRLSCCHALLPFMPFLCKYRKSESGPFGGQFLKSI